MAHLVLSIRIMTLLAHDTAARPAPGRPRANSPRLPTANASPARLAAGFAAGLKAHGRAPQKGSLAGARGKRRNSLATRGGGAPRSAGADRRTFGRAMTRHVETPSWRPAPNDAGRSPCGAPPRHLSTSGRRLNSRRAVKPSTRVTRAAAKWPAKPGSPEREVTNLARGNRSRLRPSVCLRKAPSCRVGMRGPI